MKITFKYDKNYMIDIDKNIIIKDLNKLLSKKLKYLIYI